MKAEKIKPIPKYIIQRIKRADKKSLNYGTGFLRFYSYFTKNDGELIKVIVVCKNKNKNWHCKQVIVHGIHSENCFIKDIEFYSMCGYVVGWYSEGIEKYPKWYEDGIWYEVKDKYFNPFAPVVNMEYVLATPKYKYCAITQFVYVDALKYLRLYEAYPQAEMLVKLGMKSLALSKIILHKVGKDKRFRKWLASNKDNLSKRTYYVETVLQTYKKVRR